MILDIGFNELVEDVYDDISNGEAGTSTTLFDKNQTGVISSIGSTDIALSTKVLATKRINATYVLDTTLANSNTVTEYEINNGSIAYNRCTKAGVAKTSNDELTMIHTWDFQVII